MTDYSDPLNPQFSGVGLCAVCGLTATGVHYGAATCNACKAFFKRTVHSCLTYLCASSTDGQVPAVSAVPARPPIQDPKQQSPLCPVNNASRKQCPACRWRRCLMSGMQPGMLRTLLAPSRSDNPGCTGLRPQPPGPLPRAAARAAAAANQAASGPAASTNSSADTPRHSLTVCWRSRKRTTIRSMDRPQFSMETSTMGEDFLSVEPRELAVIVLPCLDAHSARLVQLCRALAGSAMPDRIRLLAGPLGRSGLIRAVHELGGPSPACCTSRQNVCVPPGRVSAFNSSLAMRASQQIRLTARLLTEWNHFDNPDEIDKLQSTFLRELRRICPDVVRRGKLMALSGRINSIRLFCLGFWSSYFDRQAIRMPQLFSEMLQSSVNSEPSLLQVKRFAVANNLAVPLITQISGADGSMAAADRGCCCCTIADAVAVATPEVDACFRRRPRSTAAAALGGVSWRRPVRVHRDRRLEVECVVQIAAAAAHRLRARLTGLAGCYDNNNARIGTVDAASRVDPASLVTYMEA
uniref:Nuclear receptor domain-containing protein n=1 Tax=Macrostomum lignano TaxID=282301 RepID=A0A1I8JMT0_9PLAT